MQSSFSEYASLAVSPTATRSVIGETEEATTASNPATPFPSSTFAFEAAVENDVDVCLHTVNPPTTFTPLTPPATTSKAPAGKMPANRKGKVKRRVRTEAPPPPECTKSTAKYYALGHKHHCKLCREAGFILSQQYERDIVRRDVIWGSLLRFHAVV
ncbi:hypothetical protein NLJ89_g3589 [Agrocybe chaxingu]|uniref:Uncharacterized protein n=1 Tax=Agrocybe chaxingu TaxID=84603 RepID=A0A9W8K4G0_9AGAR|nr:hypothetical protein NLJ89_g3589 [Agrocybe chaxingu]